MNKKLLSILFVSLFLLSGCTLQDLEDFQSKLPDYKEQTQTDVNGSISLASWNLKIFGDTKASNDELMNRYVDIISDYDIVFIQEIRDKDGSAFDKLCGKFSEHVCQVSSRAGTTISKEQYGVIYRTNIFVEGFTDYNNFEYYQGEFERPPTKVRFSMGGYELVTYVNHLKPDNVYEEMSNLEELVQNEGNVLVLGDLNLDGSYYDEDNIQHFTDWNYIIKNSDDTTVAESSNTYDRFIMNDDAYEEFVDYGIRKDDIDETLSDHYLIYLTINPN